LFGVLSSRQIDFGEVWLHRPQNHINFSALQSALTNTTATKVQKIINESLITQRDLELAIWNRNKIPKEPFVGQTIGFLTVCSPTIPFYQEQLARFADLRKLNELEEALSSYQQRSVARSFLRDKGFGGKSTLQPKASALAKLQLSQRMRHPPF
jgi:hypothetical protein